MAAPPFLDLRNLLTEFTAVTEHSHVSRPFKIFSIDLLDPCRPTENIRYVKLTQGSQVSWLKPLYLLHLEGYRRFPLKLPSSSLTPAGPLQWIILGRITNTRRSLAKINCFIFYGLVIISVLSSCQRKILSLFLYFMVKNNESQIGFESEISMSPFGARSDTLVYVGGADCTLWRRLKWAAITLLPWAIKQTRVLELVIVAKNRKTCGYDEILMKIHLFNFKIYWLI